MKKTLIAMAGMAIISAALPAIAGPDWQVIEQARKAKLTQMEKERASQAKTAQTAESTDGQQTDKEVHMDMMMKECAEMMKKPA